MRECGRIEWQKFRRYHYLNEDIPSACRCFGLYDGETIVGFMGVLHQPHGINKKLKRVSRLVILPDYQGIGLGVKFLNFVGGIYKAQGYDFTIVTSARNMIFALRKNGKWIMTRWSNEKCNSPVSLIDYNRKTVRGMVKTAAFVMR